MAKMTRRRASRPPRGKAIIAAGLIFFIVLCLSAYLALTGNLPWGRGSADVSIRAIAFEIRDGGFLAACHTDEGVAVMGKDYFFCGCSRAVIYDASGRKITVSEIERGSEAEIVFGGIIQETYPVRISAEKVTVTGEAPLELPDILPPIVSGGYPPNGQSSG
jgi:hypothetical protein